MLLKLLRYLFGYLKVEVKGFAPERFMNLIIKNDIVVWCVDSTDNGFIFYTGRKNLLKMKPLLQKTNVKLSILEKRGLPYLIKKNKKRVFFVLGFFICIFAIYVMSLFVWEVKISGVKQIVAQEMLKNIESNYVKLGTLKKEIDCDKLEQQLMKEYNEISWINCNLNGTTLIVSIEEGVLPDEIKENISQNDIVALKDATITKMITREGKPVAKVNDQVKKGDILISGTIYIYNDNCEVLETNYVAADGDIYGESIEKYEDVLDCVCYEKSYDNKNRHFYTFFIFDYCMTPFKPKYDNKNVDVITQIHKLKLFSDLYLPIGYKENTMKSYKVVKKTYNDREAAKVLNHNLSEKIKELQSKGVEIVENNVKIEKNGNQYFATGTLKIRELIGGVRELSVLPPEVE
ncbi:MAG: sporulation protein YqfD [Lachnospiraceae bacterium]